MNIIDLFAGGGGASLGILQALGVGPAVAVNHDPEAIEMHATNHPECVHLCEDVFRVAPFRPGGKPIDLLWASPNCTHFSRAKGAAPKDHKIRLLAWVIVEWARAVHPRVICCENVTEWQTWGPLDDEGHPIEERKGETFVEFVSALRLAGYRVEWRELNAADFGAPTARRRLFLVARNDGLEIEWPEPTHGPGRIPYHTAGECIDWTVPGTSIFGRVKPLADKTLARIAAGLVRYVLPPAVPFIAPTLPTGPADPVLVAAWLAKHYGGVVGQSLSRPLGTVTTQDHHALCTVTLSPEPSGHAPKVAAFLIKYYGSGVGQRLDEPLHTITCADRFGLVTVTLDGRPYVVTDVATRMLLPRELARGQGFPDDYILTGPRRAQTARIGNSVAPPAARALVAAQFGRPQAQVAA